MSRAALRRYFHHGLFPQLVVFEAVARLGSVTRAAEELHLAQPTVSLQLKKLARTLELALFVRMDTRLAAFRSCEAQTLALAPELPARVAHGELRLARDDGVYLFELEVEGLPVIKGAAHARPRS